ncbi:MbtH family NRPS accessory protein [Nonomuraea sp. LP-02]|uniref:MbtH family NRPS accessory protein n=1 Tax=Nonomuraea sp. LP-02 TaxID=3097960 RepID=UPI002E3325F4|nr:MbtH family NRPS accessory protein [Nonomuraea sp. LP-02]MED7930477.1 MbtH family NRPS accessory protein [Nonomuraea sp. LP-02]
MRRCREDHYSLWPADRSIPSGWSDTGTFGTKDDCLDVIDKLGTDMQLLSPRSSRI